MPVLVSLIVVRLVTKQRSLLSACRVVNLPAPIKPAGKVSTSGNGMATEWARSWLSKRVSKTQTSLSSAGVCVSQPAAAAPERIRWRTYPP